jgi:hypothetical protein
MLGAVPSDLFPYWDVPRFAECLVDGEETIPEGAAAINANARAKALVRAAEGKIAEAVRYKAQYTLQELRDLVYNVQSGGVNGVIMGDSLMSLIADVVWCMTIGRKRYSAESPQGRDPACKNSQDYLDRLQKGERIFVLQGVAIRDENGALTGEYYGTQIPDAGVLEGGRLHSNIDLAQRFWGNANRTGLPYPYGYGTDEDGVPVG